MCCKIVSRWRSDIIGDSWSTLSTSVSESQIVIIMTPIVQARLQKEMGQANDKFSQLDEKYKVIMVVLVNHQW